jgi:hypothetical protein
MIDRSVMPPLMPVVAADLRSTIDAIAPHGRRRARDSASTSAGR